ncbi:hypothetical protein MLD38_024949 [Melastoma candidum]|uniref:Uncharacterized protein n=1 Tax=Melastoma candidum TaxID=119954 RepID=A0ACB9NTY7_9MYRT|nr:hypothetical protein MLD38_024949 [Melastoma candidum]
MDIDIDDSVDRRHDLSPTNRIRTRLAQIGVPEDYLLRPKSGLVDFVKDNNASWIPQIISVILPSDEEVAEIHRKSKAESQKSVGVRDRFKENNAWLQWLMFGDDPQEVLKYLSELNVGQRGVCGAVWGNNDIAYRCRTCEHDATCAICVPCFENGNHEGHDYSTIYTGGGCCDCGDVTAWKREGFCSKHKGTEQIQPLPPEIAKSMGPVLDSLFTCWKNKLMVVESYLKESSMENETDSECRKFANELSRLIVMLLLDFCKHSESLLSFIADRIVSSSGLLEILVRTEGFLTDVLVRKLHELLLKLLAEPSFKYNFARAFLSYYPVVVNEAVKDCNDEVFKKHAALSTFSVQIFTVPTLTPRLVTEMNLLEILFGCLGDIFISCIGDDGHLQVSKWQSLYETTIRVVHDIRFVMSHVAVRKYVFDERREMLRTWMRLLTFVQGINPQRRETGIHVEEEIEITHLPFGLCFTLANTNILLIDGVFSESAAEGSNFTVIDGSQACIDNNDDHRHAKVGRLSQQSSACCTSGRDIASASNHITVEVGRSSATHFSVPQSVSLMIFECLRAIGNWLLLDNSIGTSPMSLYQRNMGEVAGNFSALARTLLKIRKGRNLFRRLGSPIGPQFSSQFGDFSTGIDIENKKSIIDKLKLFSNESNSTDWLSRSSENSTLEGDSSSEGDALRLFSLQDWPDILYDVSTQDVSVHIPLHRLLSLLIMRSLGRCYGECVTPRISAASFPAETSEFFNSILHGCHPIGFSAFLMEHPLRIKVFCAEVHAGMWKKNGEAALLSCEWYHSARWSDQGLEFDLFMLQCCAALAPADLFIRRILERFGLSSYILLNLERTSEYEPILVQEMLTLIIQIIKERRFSGLKMADSVKRELIYKLTIGDATHSQLVKSLPPDLSKFSGLQDVLDSVASYSNPSSFNQGTYILRWQYWKELDLYHSRYNSRELQTAEERYVRFCSASALTVQLPQWTFIYPPLSGISGLATCRTTLEIIRSVLFYAVLNDNVSESRGPDNVLIPSLHLLFLALDICFQQKESHPEMAGSGESVPVTSFALEEMREGESYGIGKLSLLSLLVFLMKMHGNEKADNLVSVESCDLSPLIDKLLRRFAELDSACVRELQLLAPELVSQISPSLEVDVGGLGSVSDSEKRRAKARERQAAIMEKMKAEQTKFLESINSMDESQSPREEATFLATSHKTAENTEVVCSLCHDSIPESPLSFLVLLQRSRLLSHVDRSLPSWDNLIPPKGSVQIKRKSEAGQSGVESMDSPKDMSPGQLTTVTQNAVNKLVQAAQQCEVNDFIEYVKVQFPSLRNIHLPEASYQKERSLNSFDSIERDMYRLVKARVTGHDCFMDYGVKEKDIVTTKEVSKDYEDAEIVLLGKYIAHLSRERAGNMSMSEHIDQPAEERTQSVSPHDGFGPIDCDGIFLSSCGHAVHKGCLDCYLSSLKERYARRIVFEGGHIVDLDQGEFLCPVCRQLANSVLPGVSEMSAQNSARDVSSGTCSVANSNNLSQGLHLLQSAADLVKNLETFKADISDSGLLPELESFLTLLHKKYSSGKLEKQSGPPSVGRSALMWDTLRYSLISTEVSARSRRTSLDPNISINTLFKEFATSGEFVLSLLLRVLQSTRCNNTLDVLQRFRGLMVFAESVRGVSCSSPSSDSIFCILACANMGTSYSVIQFWKRAMDPVLSHDPFSSLMWILYCLPHSFLSCEESLLSLVHVFYVVSVTQATISYLGKCGGKMDNPRIQDCLITDICKFMGESGCFHEYFFLHNVDQSLDIQDAVSLMTLPYLRRCALIWKLVKLPTSIPLDSSVHELNRTTSVLETDNLGNFSWMALNEVEELKKMLQVPSIGDVYQDGTVRHIVSRWLHHFTWESEHCKIKGVVECSTAVPFRLMQLPHLYQDLLQRYIKQQCPNCKSILQEPALCLLCSKLCSPSWKPCCRESSCQSHAYACGSGTGVFLLIRRTTILLLRNAHQALWPSPYLDAFGEEDTELQRGKPLYLNEERCAALTYMVASHGLDRSSKILRQTTIGPFIL